jgi:hypothetical protein
MGTVKCTRDNEGYWTEGEVYRSESEGEICGNIRINDDGNEVCDWILSPTDWDEELQIWKYELVGLDAEFIEVA